MIAILIDDKSQASIINAYNSICDSIGVELFSKLLSVTLTDRGTEFSNPYALEQDTQDNEKTKVFYCDPYCSWQKPHVERNHEFIRQILPKGSSFDNLTGILLHKKILIASEHIITVFHISSPFLSI